MSVAVNNSHINSLSGHTVSGRGDTMSEIVMIGGNNYKVQKEQDGSISLLRYNDKFGIWVKVRFSSSEEKIAEVIKDTLSDEYIKNAAMGAIDGVLKYPLQSESASVKMTSHLKREAV